MRPGALLFDLDGTLVDTVETRIRAWLRAFEEFSMPADRAQVATLIGSDGRFLARAVGEAAGQPIDEAQAERVDQRAGAIYGRLNTDPRPLPGARALLTALADSGLRWAIATSSRREQVDASIQALELQDRPIVIDGSNVANAKPAPDLLLFAARQLRVRPSRTWYVGDSTWDMLAAAAAGMRAIGVTSGAATAEQLQGAGAWLTVDNLNQILPLIQDK